MKLFNVLIIGAGKIGSFFDDPKSKNILTHAHAFSLHKGFNLLGFVDKDKKKALKAAKKWNTKAYDNIKKAFKLDKIDVVCVTASTDMHQTILAEVSKYPVKLILLEKPIAKTFDESKKILKLCDKTKIPIAINYIRRFLPEFEKIKKDIDSGIYGNFINGTGYYGKGMLNNGSHIIDLLNFFFDRISDFKVIDSFNDYSANDLTVTSVLTLSNKKSFIMQGINSKLFTLFEMDLIFEKQRVRIIESGQKIEFYRITENKNLKGYRNMLKYSEFRTSLGRYMYHVADNIYKNLTKGEEIKCNVLDGYNAAGVCFKMLEK